MATGAAAVIAPHPCWDLIPLREIEDAGVRQKGVTLRPPVVRLDAGDLLPPGPEVFLKLECLQPVRSFKLRGAYNAMAKPGRRALADGVWTVSSGNMAQVLTWAARALGVPATVYVPDSVPRTKLANIVRYGATPVELPFAELTTICLTRHRDGAPGRFIHPYSDPDLMAGSGTVGLELLEDLLEVDAVIAPFGDGDGNPTRVLLNERDLTEGTGVLSNGEVVLATDDDVYTSEVAGGGGIGNPATSRPQES
jgi:threonine dehydratase